MFDRLGRVLAQRPALCVAAWAVLLIAAAVWSHLAPPIAPSEVGSFLPRKSPHNISSEIIKDALPAVLSNSMLAVIAERPAGLRTADYLWLDRMVNDIREQSSRVIADGTPKGQPKPQISSLSPAMPFVRGRLVSRDGQAALGIVNLPTNFI